MEATQYLFNKRENTHKNKILYDAHSIENPLPCFCLDNLSSTHDNRKNRKNFLAINEAEFA